MVICPYCEVKRDLISLSQLSRHVQYVHYDKQNNQVFNCIVPNCELKKIKGPTNILRHFRTNHLADPGFEFLNPDQNILTNQNISTDQLNFNDEQMDSLDCNFEIENNFSQEQIDSAIPTYLLDKIKELSIEDKYCDLVISQKKRFKTTELAAIGMADKLMEFIVNGLKKGELNVDKIDQLRKSYGNYFYNVNKNIIERQVDSSVLQEKMVKINNEKFKFYYLPIIPTIKKILADPIAMKYIMKFHREPPNSEYFTSIKDAENFPFDPNSKIVKLYIQIYNDGFGITRNPNTKIDVFYFTLLNLPYWMQSSRDSIYTCMVVESSVLKEITHEALVEYFIKDVQEVADNMIELSDGYKAKIILHSCSADNEASNKMMDTGGFRGKFCKRCDVSYEQLQSLYSGEFNLNNEPILTKEMPESHAFNSLTDKFYCLEQFYTFDLFHDWSSSGIMIKVLRPMICKFYIYTSDGFRRDKKGFKIKKRNLIEKFKKLKHPNGLISDIDDDGNALGTCTQVSDFFLLFAYLDELVDRDSEQFKIYLVIRNIYLYLKDERLRKDQIGNVEKAIKNFLSQYHNLYKRDNTESIIPKMHHIDHYCESIKKMANPLFYKTTRYERKHQELKNNQLMSRQFKNKPFSISKWEALTRKIEFSEIGPVVFKKLKLNLNNVNNYVFKNFLNLQQEYESVKEVKIKGIQFKKNVLFRLKNELEFVEIVEIFKQNDKFLITGSCIKPVDYITNKAAYKVDYKNQIMKIDEDQIFHNELIFIREEMLVIKDF